MTALNDKRASKYGIDEHPYIICTLINNNKTVKYVSEANDWLFNKSKLRSSRRPEPHPKFSPYNFCACAKST